MVLEEVVRSALEIHLSTRDVRVEAEAITACRHACLSRRVKCEAAAVAFHALAHAQVSHRRQQQHVSPKMALIRSVTLDLGL